MKKLEQTDKVRAIPKDFFESQAAHWDLRYGGKDKDKNLWRLTAIIALLTALIAVTGYVKLASEGKYIPYIVQLDKLGTAVSYNPASRIKEVDHRVLEATLGRFVYCFRTVSIDKRTLKVNVDELYSYLNGNDPAYNKLTQYFSEPKNDPYKRAEKIVTSIDITSVMQIPSGEWVIKWRETAFTRKGKMLPAISGTYQAIINLIVVPSSINNEKDMNLKNPLGIYIRDISWQKDIKK